MVDELAVKIALDSLSISTKETQQEQDQKMGNA
jgi:hypothetical protein